MRPVHLTKFTARMSIFFFFDGFGFACATTVATVPIACCSFFRLAEAGAVLADVQAKHNDIKRLEQDITEVMQMFEDLSILISQQGELVDSIESHVEAA